MENHFLRLKDKQSLQDAINRSDSGPVIIFKHSTTCPISAAAYREMEQVGSPVNLIEVQSAPAISEEIENRFGVRHESPQVILLRRGKPVWNASHWQIKASAVSDAVADNTW